MKAQLVEERIQKHLDTWLDLLGLTGWKVTYEVLHVDPDTVAHNDYFKHRDGSKTAHMRFVRQHLKSDQAIEDAVLHELLHLLDHGIGNDLHKFIYRLEKPLRRARRRMAQAKSALS